jgi:hypothetical protein
VFPARDEAAREALKIGRREFRDKLVAQIRNWVAWRLLTRIQSYDGFEVAEFDLSGYLATAPVERFELFE